MIRSAIVYGLVPRALYNCMPNAGDTTKCRRDDAFRLMDGRYGRCFMAHRIVIRQCVVLDE